MAESAKKALSEEAFRSIIAKWMETTTIHGFPGIKQNKNMFFKLMWAVLLVVSFAVCALLVVETVITVTLESPLTSRS
jgi:hypothetical protein